MHRVNKSVLVGHSATQMFELVDRVELYPEFLPWCSGAKVLESHPCGKTACLEIDFHGIRTHFTTDNTNTPGQQIVVTLRSGPFRHLHGEWRFRGLAEDACKVEFELVYEFATTLLDGAIGPMFNRIATTFVESFVRRADAVYGEHP